MAKLITVHGTGAGAREDEGELWWQKGSGFLSRLGEVLDLSRVDIVPFHWDIGANSETTRRKAGLDLYRQLAGLDEQGEDYYLIGHSHGGSVIYNALLVSARRGKPLHRLQGWCTIGAPFIDLAPKRFLLSRLNAPGLAVYMLGVLAVLVTAALLASNLAGTDLARLIDQKLKEAALGHLQFPLMASALTLALTTYVALVLYERVTERWIPDRTKRKAAELYAGSWIGLAHEDDEAIAALRAASEFKPEIVPRSFLAEPMSKLPILIMMVWLVAVLWTLERTLSLPLDQLQSVVTTLQSIKPRALDTSTMSFMPGLGGMVWWLVLLTVALGIATIVVQLFRMIGGWISPPLAAAIDRLVWSSVRDQVWGDDLRAEAVRGVSSHPPQFALRYRPLPPAVADRIADIANQSAASTLKKLRTSLGMQAASSRGGDFLGSALNQLSWQELIHTAYFASDEFTRLTAFALHRQGLAGLVPGAWTPEHRATARDGLQAMTLADVAHAGDVERVGSGRTVAHSSSLDLSVTQKTLFSLGIVVGAFVVGMLLTALVLPWQWAAIIWLGGAVITVILAEVLPVSTRDLGSIQSPARSYDEAKSRFEAWSNEAEATIHPRCTPFLLGHGLRTARSYVLVHGISNCPYSMVDFAPKLHALGHNVLVVRMPFNGHLDNGTDALRHLTGRELRVFSDQSIDIAAGLGQHVHVIGISAGGVIAGWMAQNRPEIDRAVLLAPAYGLSSFGTGLNNALMRLVLFMPHFSVWKDPVRRAAAENRPHSYKRQSTRGMGEVMRLGLATVRQAKAQKPRAVSITLVTNAADAAVDPTMPEALAKMWEQKATPVTRYVFPKELGLPHELIDPTEDGANTKISHPKIIELAERPPETQRSAPIA